MSNLITSVKIKKLFNEKDVNWELKKINVLVGKNGLGKSTILRLINSAVTRKEVDDLELCEEVIVEIKNQEKYVSRKSNMINLETLRLVIEELARFDKPSPRKDKNSDNPYIKYKTLNNKELSKLTTDLFERLNRSATNNEVETSNKKINVKKDNLVFKPKDRMSVEFISTINMSANSVNNVIESDGNKTTFLDVEIDKEIERLNKDHRNKNELQERFINSLSKFLEETNKKVEFVDDQIEIILISGKRIDYRNLSSGERQLIFIFLKVINGSVDNSLILMDEPEISLHLSWQEKLLTEITSANSSSQMIIVTHSPALVMDGWLNNFIDIKTITEEVW